MSQCKITEHKLQTLSGILYLCRWTPENPKSHAPIVLFHDSLGCTALWRDFPETLARQTGHPVISYDRYGFGQSSARDALPGINFIDLEAEQIFPVIQDQMQLTSYYLLGHSVGGGMALSVAARNKGCLGVISISAQAFVEEKTRSGIRQALTLFEDKGQLGKLQKWHGQKTQWVLNAWAETWLSERFSHWSLAPVLSDVTCPVLILHGDKDEYGSERFPEAIKNGIQRKAKMIILKNCAHVPHREQPETVLREITAFMESC